MKLVKSDWRIGASDLFFIMFHIKNIQHVDPTSAAAEMFQGKKQGGLVRLLMVKEKTIVMRTQINMLFILLLDTECLINC